MSTRKAAYGLTGALLAGCAARCDFGRDMRIRRRHAPTVAAEVPRDVAKSPDT